MNYAWYKIEVKIINWFVVEMKNCVDSSLTHGFEAAGGVFGVLLHVNRHRNAVPRHWRRTLTAVAHQVCLFLGARDGSRRFLLQPHFLLLAPQCFRKQHERHGEQQQHHPAQEETTPPHAHKSSVARTFKNLFFEKFALEKGWRFLLPIRTGTLERESMWKERR